VTLYWKAYTWKPNWKWDNGHCQTDMSKDLSF